MNPLVKAVDLRKSYGEFQALHGINLDVAKGEVLCIIGPSGSGKSTFLRCINQLETISGGALWVNDELVGYRRVENKLYPLSEKQMARQRLATGMVFQRFNLFPHMTALDNVIEGMVSVKGIEKAKARIRGRQLLDRVGLLGKADEYPARLSGGQKQRVAIARALAMDPEVIFFDEPTSALDPELRDDVLEVMRELAEEGMTMLVVTHETRFARDVADRIVFMEGGHIIEDTTPDHFFGENASERCIQFLGRIRD